MGSIPAAAYPAKYIRLYLGEVCYRFNHGNKDLKPVQFRLLRQIQPIDCALSQVLKSWESLSWTGASVS